MSLKETLNRIKTGRTEIELGRQYPAIDLKHHLESSEPIVYRKNGNRAIDGEKFYRALKPALARIGVTRVGNISDLSASRFPVYQSCRPNIFDHPDFGQNTGSQGKGYTNTQAKLSCVMETFESYCAEPKHPELIRGSYRNLHRQHVMLNPRFIATYDNVRTPKESDVLMWARAYSLSQKQEILVPAQSIYFPFFSSNYHTKSYFPCGSNGLASGATFLEAAIHGIYELIERHYLGAAQAGFCKVEAIFEGRIRGYSFDRLLESMGREYELQLYSFEITKYGRANLPFIFCSLVGPDRSYLGYGCSTNVDLSISRAVSEAMQSIAVTTSGTREDMTGANAVRNEFSVLNWPDDRTLDHRDLKKRVVDREFRNLLIEFKFVVDWLKRLGHHEICFANLTRAGVEVPVLKVLVPSLVSRRRYARPANAKPENRLKSQYHIESL